MLRIDEWIFEPHFKKKMLKIAERNPISKEIFPQCEHSVHRFSERFISGYRRCGKGKRLGPKRNAIVSKALAYIYHGKLELFISLRATRLSHKSLGA